MFILERERIRAVWTTPGGRGRGRVLPYMGYMGMCDPKAYGFTAVLAINRISTLAILVINREAKIAHFGHK